MFDGNGHSPYDCDTGLIAMATEKKPSAIPQYQPSDIEAGVTHNADLKSSYWLGLAKKLSIETGGIQRVTEEECEHNATHVWNACTFW